MGDPCQTESVDMGLCVKGQKFVRLIDTVQYLILLMKHNILSKVTALCVMNNIEACIQNLILKGVFSVHNLLSSNCCTYFFVSPVTISNRSNIIQTLSGNSIQLLHKMHTSFITYDKQFHQHTDIHAG